MKHLLPAIAVGMAMAGAAPVHAADQGNIVNGEKVYQAWCASCHAAGIGNPGNDLKPGADAIRAKYNGRVPAVLSERTDLTPEVVRLFVRQGASVMAFFRKTEISDRDLADLGAYLSRNNSRRDGP